jgi:serine/threonine protein kinase
LTLKVLKAGGFGITYETMDVELERRVVIKEYYPSSIVNRDGTDTVMPSRTHVKVYEKGLEDFLDEARTLAKFDTNPNIVNIIEHFRANGTAYFVMPFEEGEDLARYLDEHGKMSEKEILDIIFPILNALQEIHKIGMIHRDIKPANIFIRKNKSPLLIDFGTARYAFGQNSKSLTSILTAGYAPIEQYDSHSVQGAYTDIYALGATIYTMATNTVPPESTSRSLAKLRNSADPLKPISSSNFSLEFSNAVSKALNIMEKDRYQTIEEFEKALGGIERPPKPPKDFKVLKLVGLSCVLVGALYYPVSIGVDKFFEKKEELKIDKNDSKNIVFKPVIVENNITQPVIEEANVSVAEEVNIDETYENDRVIKNRGGTDTTVHHTSAKTVTVAKQPVSHYVIPKGFYIKVYSAENVSPDFLKKIVDKGFDYKLSKAPSTEANDTSPLTRVFIGPYYSEQDARDVLSKVQELSPNAYIIKM